MDSLPESIRIGASSPCGVQLEFDLAVYRLSAIKKAAYRFGDRFHVQLATRKRSEESGAYERSWGPRRCPH